MRSGDGGGLEPRLEERLRNELDRVQPRFSSPRYMAASHRPVLWRVAPAVLAAAILGMVGLTAYAGSPNPAVWTERVVNVVHPSTSSPTPEQIPTQNPLNPAPSQAPEHHQSPEPSEKPEPTEAPEPSGSPEPRESPEPSGSPEAHQTPEPSGGGTSGGGGSDGGGTPE